MAILAQDCPRTNRDVYRFDGEVVEKVFDGSSSEAKQRRPTSACGGVYCTCASGDLIARASGGVPCTRTCGDPLCFASGGVYCTRARGVSRASVPSLSGCLSGCLGHVFA